jgi:AcrR family transcriptional regulator
MAQQDKKIDPRVIRTRKLLKESILSLIPEKSFHKITIQDITDRATLNRVTFYLHYDNKLDLLQDASYEILDDLVQSYGRHTIFSSPEAPYSIVLANFEHVQKHEAFYKALLARDGVLPFIRSLEDYIYKSNLKRLQDERGAKFEITLEHEIILRLLAAAIVGTASWWLENDQPCSPTKIADTLTLVFKQGYYQPLLDD